MELEERLIICEKEMQTLSENITRCERLVEAMVDEQKEYAKKYTAFLDMLIEEKKESKRLRDRALDSAASGTAWAGITFVGLAIWYYIKEQIRK